MEMVLLGLMAIASGWLLLVTTGTADSPLTFPVVGPIAVGTLFLLLGLHRFVHPVPDAAIDDHGLAIGPFGRIPWSAISRIHLITVHGARYLAIELVAPGPKITERCWPRWIYGPVGKVMVGYPIAMPERWLRPISLDDIATEIQRRNPGLVIARSEREGFGRARL
ncbi:hypothetical protein NDR87_36190 [Nocardia sp. CDC159]|uniref:PH domain-containing protein n=1 Tax=Nocardia pulmonis TaxID=2951408 RepID=A0A9X2J1I9_9NOCA|nr:MULTISPECIES: hypothetical protein [Nocardia]MCM6778929.1 hypothetical protein [Nocardia pulmonis]MCM6791818.1 hypothetical protein [Nocardia sp. CDC159]